MARNIPFAFSAPSRALELKLSSGDACYAFRLSPNDERVVTVGATTSADVHFDEPDISPIHFYFERIDRDIWVVPAYCVPGLRLDGIEVSTPVRLLPQARLEFSRRCLEVTISPLVESPALAPSATNHSGLLARTGAPGGIPNDEIPAHTCASNDGEDAIETRELSTIARLEHSEASRANDGSLGSVPSHAEREDLAKTVHFRAARPRLKQEPPSAQTRAASPSLSIPTATPELASLKKTLYGVSPALLGLNGLSLVGDSEQRNIPTLSDCPQVSIPPARWESVLVRLGRLTKRRPATVFATAILVALLSSALVVTLASMLIRYLAQADTTPSF